MREKPSYLKCPWCGYADVPNEFGAVSIDTVPAYHCHQCEASGIDLMFILAYHPTVTLAPENEQYRDLYLGLLQSTPHGEQDA